MEYLYYMFGLRYTILVGNIPRVPDQNGVSQGCYIVEIYHSGAEPLIYDLPNNFKESFLTSKTLTSKKTRGGGVGGGREEFNER